MVPKSILLVALAASYSSAANIVINPSFEASTVNCRGTACNAPQSPWVFTLGGTTSTFGIVAANPAAPGGGARHAYLGSGESLFDTISQLLVTAPGQTYTLSFWLDTGTASHVDGDFRVRWNGALIYEDGPGTDAAHQFTYKQIVISNLTGTGNDLLAFQGFNFSGNDRFDLVDVQATPEPSTIYTGFVSLAFLYARQRNRRMLLFHNGSFVQRAAMKQNSPLCSIIIERLHKGLRAL